MRLPSLEEPAPGMCCPRCAEPLRIENFCATCFERSLEVREAAIRRDHETAKKRARAWQLDRAVRS